MHRHVARGRRSRLAARAAVASFLVAASAAPLVLFASASTASPVALVTSTTLPGPLDEATRSLGATDGGVTTTVPELTADELDPVGTVAETTDSLVGTVDETTDSVGGTLGDATEPLIDDVVVSADSLVSPLPEVTLQPIAPPANLNEGDGGTEPLQPANAGGANEGITSVPVDSAVLPGDAALISTAATIDAATGGLDAQPIRAALASTITSLGFPLALAAAAAAFAVAQGRVDSRDPKLAAAPLDALESTLPFG